MFLTNEEIATLTGYQIAACDELNRAHKIGAIKEAA